MPSEVVIVCTYKREEFLHCCLRRLRGQDGDIRIIVFSDRWESSDNLAAICLEFDADLILHPPHSYYGNSFAAGEALRFAWNLDYELITYVEDDCLVKPDFFRWTREVHEEWDDIFCSCGWVFNRHMPIADETYFAPWIYIPQFTIRRDKLDLLMPHLNPIYYGDLQKYVYENFHKNPINDLHPHAIQHFEIDGLLQRVLMQSGMQVAWNGIARAEHIGFSGYNKGWSRYENFFHGCTTFAERVERVEEFATDEYARAEEFGRDIVQREIGRELSKQERIWKIRLPGGWESTFKSERKRFIPGEWINTVPIPKDAKISLVP